MSVLVTGGAGYIGSHMVLRLLDAGEEVVVVDDLSEGHKWAVDQRARFVQANVGDMEAMKGIFLDNGVREVFHFAGSIRVADSVTQPLAYYANNTCNTHALLQAIVAAGVERLVFSSTAAVYGEGSGGPLRETDPLAPASPYGRSKLMSEGMIADAAAAYGFNYASLRYFNVAGADPEGRAGQSGDIASHLIKLGVQAATGQRPGLSIFGTDYPTPDGTCLRDYIHVTDLADVHWLALRHLRQGGENLIANCGYGQGFSVREIVAALSEVTSEPLRVDEAPRRAGDPPSLVSDPSLAKRLLGWTPQHDDITTIVKSALVWESHLQTRKRESSEDISQVDQKAKA